MYSRVYVEITNVCNLRCSFCHGHKRAPRQMCREEFAYILQQLKGKTEYLYYHLMGEPLLHPQLPEFLQLAGSQGFRSMLTTNGTLLHPYGKTLLEAGLHKVNISLHSFESGEEARYFQYLQQVAEFANLAGQYGTIISLRLWNQGFDAGRNDRTLAFLRQALPGQWTDNSRGYRIRDRLFLEWGERFAWPDREVPMGDAEVACYGLRDHFGILSDGTVVPCCLDSEGVICLGNVFTQELGQILKSPRAKAMAEGFRCRKATESLCRQCGYARRF